MRKKKRITKEELEEIKEHNRRKLDEVLSDDDYQIKLGKKYYGTRYYTILEEDHFLKIEHKKHIQKYGQTIPPYISRKIIQMDMEGNFIKYWESAVEWAESEGRDKRAAQHVAKCAQGNVMSQKDSAYGYTWTFKDNDGDGC